MVVKITALKMALAFSLLMLSSMSVWSASFQNNDNGTVTDFDTGLVWQQSDAHNTIGRIWNDAMTYCSNLTLAGKSDWRLPKIKELLSIVDSRRDQPAINLSNFPDTISGNYWSASGVANSSSAWHVNFNINILNAPSITVANYVRCVR